MLFRQVHLQRLVADGRNRCAGYGPDALELVTLATLADGVVLVAFFFRFRHVRQPVLDRTSGRARLVLGLGRGGELIEGVS